MLYSDDKFDDLFLSNYLNINVVPRILRIHGVGGVDVIGSDYAIRIWLNPELMAQYDLTPADIASAIERQNMESPTGNFGESSAHTFQYAMKYRGRYETPEEFGEIVIRALPDGEVLRLKDVTRIELGAQDYSMNGEADGHPGTTCMITQIAGSNASDIASEVEQLFEDIQDDLPPGVKISVTQNVKDFLDASIHNVLVTLLEAMLLVVLVVYLFLQNGRLTLIPTISMLVSMTGTFFVLALMGFSINLLTLFALVLSIGTVVDNAIIVVEAVQAKLDGGCPSAYRATVDGMGGITTAIHPRLTLSGSAGWTNSAGETIVNPGRWLLSAVGSVVQPLFDKGKNRANLNISKARQEAALLSYRQKILDAGTEVNDALKQWQTARKQLELSRQKIKELEITVESTRLLMRHGHINFLEVLTAQQLLLDAQLQEVTDKLGEVQGIITLYHALGGGGF
ncbi:MAG: efflux RND transporter permease subunit [Alloprevotella sp.]